MSVNRRLDRLEDASGGGDELPMMIVSQSLDDDDRYSDKSGNIYHVDDLDELRGQYQLIVIEYTKNWRGADQEIDLAWGDD